MLSNRKAKAQQVIYRFYDYFQTCHISGVQEMKFAEEISKASFFVTFENIAAFTETFQEMKTNSVTRCSLNVTY